jgi:transcriptional regulatory protein LevR
MDACQTGIQHFYNVIEGGTEDDAVDVTEYKQRRITLKCHTVYAALRKALETMEDNKNRLTWVQCCDYAIEAMKVVGFEDLLSSSTVRIAQRELRDNNNKFSHPNEKARKKKAAKKEDNAAEEEDSELEEGG